MVVVGHNVSVCECAFRCVYRVKMFAVLCVRAFVCYVASSLQPMTMPIQSWYTVEEGGTVSPAPDEFDRDDGMNGSRMESHLTNQQHHNDTRRPTV